MTADWFNPPVKHYQFGNHLVTSFSGEATCHNLKSPTLFKTARAFAENVQRLERLWTFAPASAFYASLRKAIEDKAELTVYGRLDAPETDRNRESEYGAEFQRLWSEWLNSLATTQGYQLGTPLFQEGVALIEFLAESGGQMGIDFFSAGAGATLGAVVIGIWAAYETLAGDLWVTSLNDRPDWGVRALGAAASADDTQGEDEQKKKKKFPVPLRKLQKWDYNLKHVMGELLRDTWKFGKREGIIAAYRAVFGKKDAALNQILEDPGLRHLAALRNALVHKAGFADKEFTDDVSGDPHLSKIREDTQIELDGYYVGNAVFNAIRQGKSLIRFVDAQLLRP